MYNFFVSCKMIILTLLALHGNRVISMFKQQLEHETLDLRLELLLWWKWFVRKSRWESAIVIFCLFTFDSTGEAGLFIFQQKFYLFILLLIHQNHDQDIGTNQTNFLRSSYSEHIVKRSYLVLFSPLSFSFFQKHFASG